MIPTEEYAKKRILAVDDAAIILSRISDTLGKYYDVITVNSGVRALRYLEKEKPDLIVLDPPRDGIHPKALPKIIRFGVEKIVYVSCKPTSLVRDLAVLMEAGYQVEKACAVDMFPGTGGIETVCSLTKICPGRIYLYPG